MASEAHILAHSFKILGTSKENPSYEPISARVITLSPFKEIWSLNLQQPLIPESLILCHCLLATRSYKSPYSRNSLGELPVIRFECHSIKTLPVSYSRHIELPWLRLPTTPSNLNGCNLLQLFNPNYGHFKVVYPHVITTTLIKSPYSITQSLCSNRKVCSPIFCPWSWMPFAICNDIFPHTSISPTYQLGPTCTSWPLMIVTVCTECTLKVWLSPFSVPHLQQHLSVSAHTIPNRHKLHYNSLFKDFL